MKNGVGTEQNTFFHGSGVEFLDQVREDGNDERSESMKTVMNANTIILFFSPVRAIP